MAEALRVWLQDVVQSVECFASSEDIRAGQRWNNEINSWLDGADFGVLCVTPENAKAPWLNFEAGALAKKISDDNRVVPITLGFSPAALDEPLKQFNGVAADRAGVLRLVTSIVESANAPVDVERTFALWWPQLESTISDIPESDEQVETPPPPDTPEMLSDIMATLRGLSNEVQELGRYVSRPVGGPGSMRNLSEMRAMAEVMARDDSLRNAVAHGSRDAYSHLRGLVRNELAHGHDAMARREREDARKAAALQDLEMEEAEVARLDSSGG